jgi:hypothetical protein
LAIILNYEVPKRPLVGHHFPARKGTTTTHNTHMHISINTLIAIAAALDLASFIGIIVLIAR